MQREVVTFGDVRFLVPAAVTREVAKLHDAGDRYGAMVLARDNHEGTPSVPRVAANGEAVTASLAMMDAALAEHTSDPVKRAQMRELAKEMTTFTTLADANAEIARLRAENQSLAGIRAALAHTGARPMHDAAAAQGQSLGAGAALLAYERAKRDPSTGYGKHVERLANAWKGQPAAGAARA